MSRFLVKTAILGLAAIPLCAGIGQFIALEAKTGDLQSYAISQYAKNLRFAVEEGPNAAIRYPGPGPYDVRLGYSNLGSYVRALTGNGYAVTRQARPSPELASFVEQIGFAPYREKSSGGIAVYDRNWRSIFARRYPDRLYGDFDSVPRLVVDTLLFIENRELLDDSQPNRNPSVEWDRFAAAAAGVVVRHINPDTKLFGGSTLATQIEKFRHSPEGRTSHPLEKLKQIASGSVRAYLDGPNTIATRERIVVDYLNSTPLGARNGHGEVHGVGDGLYVWYGQTFEAANRLLQAPAEDDETLARKAQVYKQTLSLLLAQRRPAYYFADQAGLAALTDSYLRLLANEGVIDTALRDAALRIPLAQSDSPPPTNSAGFLERKAANAVRNHLLNLMQVPSLYALDRVDVEVRSTFDAQAQDLATALLRQLEDKQFVQSNGLAGQRLLDRGDLTRVDYSFTILERGADANYVRIQADNRDQPLDLNEGVKLDFGSTAKLRTLVTYLEIFAELHGRYAHLAPDELTEVSSEAADELTRWAAGYLAGTTDKSLSAMLAAAMERRYSASPTEQFFTGGGLHSFVNFERSDNGKIMPVSEALRRSVNLVFIRMMRDIVKYYTAEGPLRPGDLLGDRHHPSRQDYLSRFADNEGSEILSQIYRRYRGQSADQALTTLAARTRASADRLAVIFRSVRPNDDAAALGKFLRAQLPQSTLDDAGVQKLYEKFGPDRYNLADRGYLARIHPLELWLVAFMQSNASATRAEIMAASATERQEAYAWLFRTKHKSAQDVRIRILLEEEAFQRIHERWKRLGFPFDSLVPSYATSIGSSADRPSALAELMGIILNDGVRQPTVRVDRLHFAADTPYETLVEAKPAAPERVLPVEVAQTVRKALTDVVENGTARRVHNAFLMDGVPLVVGGKTGTGDHRFERYGPGGKLLESRVVARNAVFVFFIGERFFGTVTVHVGGPDAANYDFTSGLATQILKMMGPALQPLLVPSPTPPVVSTAEAPKGS